MKYAGTKEEVANSVEMYGPNGENLPNSGRYDENYRYSQTQNGIKYAQPQGIDHSFGIQATNYANNYFSNQSQVGIAPRIKQKAADAGRSKLEQVMGGSLLDSDGNPDGPGFAYFNHLFQRMGGEDKIKDVKKEKLSHGSNIYTEAQEALKVAMQALGVASSYNPTGLPIDVRDAKKIWFGDEDVDPDKLKQWRSSIEMGDSKIDPKKVRKFTNYDGSQTWECLNDDKTVSSRFTLGEYAGTKIFSQGGYNKFTEMLEKVKKQVGYDEGTGFDSMRSKY